MKRPLTLFSSALLAVALAAPASATIAPDPLDGASQTAAASVGAPETGYTGAGVGVAVIDTGVSPQHATLGDRVVAQVDVSGIGRGTDGLGHGTFLGGLIVGQEGPAGHRLGIAPDADLISIKVADAHGRTSLDRIVAGLAAIKAAPVELNIKVVVIAIGGPADELPDPVEQALEQMWADGYFVVVSSGNTGGELAEPGTSPYLMTVGAVDDAGTADPADDSVPAWSGSGSARDGAPKPDVLAPGRALVSTRMPGAIADRDNPDSRIQGHWFRGSGTSQAAAVAGGAAAVLYQAMPNLTPDEVKGRLVASARSVAGSHAGTIDLPAALASDAVANGHLPPITTSAPAVPDEGDWHGKMWNGKMWNGQIWVGQSWVDLAWDGKMWNGQVWLDEAWAAESWANASWDGKMWDGKMWNDGAWFGKMWNGGDWAGVEWLGRSWY